MSRLPGINKVLVDTIRRINAHYIAIPADRRPEFDDAEWESLGREVDAACLSGDREHALAAIANWERHALEACEAVLERG